MGGGPPGPRAIPRSRSFSGNPKKADQGIGRGPGGPPPNDLLLGCCVRARGAFVLQVLVIPGKVALVAITNVTGSLDSVEFIGIDDHLRVDSQTPQRLIHLLAALNRN